MLPLVIYESSMVPGYTKYQYFLVWQSCRVKYWHSLVMA